MANHVHVPIKPIQPLRKVTQWIKGASAREANLMFGRAGEHFWQVESYDHWERGSDECTRIADYIEYNPVKAGLVESPEQWPWSSAQLRRGARAKACAY